MDDVMKGLNEPIGVTSANLPLTYRGIALRDGAKIDTCELSGDVSRDVGIFGTYTMRNGIDLKEGIDTSDIVPSDAICGLTF